MVTEGKIQRYFLSEGEKRSLFGKIELFIKSRKEVLFAYLHGSFFDKGYFKDIDVALYVGTKEITVLDYELDLEVLLQDKFGYPFDVRVLNKCPVSFSYRVIKEGKRMCVADDDQRTTFEEDVLSRYLGFLPYYKRYLSEGYGIRI